MRNKLKYSLQKIYNSILKKYIYHNSDVLLACSREAAEYMFGTDVLKSEKYHIIHNAIQTDKFSFQPQIRKTVREAFNLDEKSILLGSVGRISRQKNPLYLIDVFYEFHQLYSNSILWIVGDGVLREDVESKVHQLNLSNSVLFLGQRTDVNELMQAMDMLVLPSLYEGLGIVAIEAQTAGVQVFISNESSHESNLTDIIHFIPLDDGPEKWANEMKKCWEKKEIRRSMQDRITEGGYNIYKEYRVFETIYFDLAAEKQISCQKKNTAKEQ